MHIVLIFIDENSVERFQTNIAVLNLGSTYYIEVKTTINA